MIRRQRFLALAGLCAAFLASACQTVPGAPEGSPRVEAALRIDVDSSLVELFEAPQRKLEVLVRDTVFPHADMGLRLYPVPMASYGSSDTLPEYHLRIEVTDFGLSFNDELVENEQDGTSRVVKEIDEMTCRARVTLQRLRPGSPHLVVGTATGKGKLAASMFRDLSAKGGLRVRPQAAGGERIVVARDHVRDVIDEAVVEALRELTKPTDREFSVAR